MSSENKENNGVFSKVKKSFTTRKFKQGAYATALSVIVIVLVVVVNLFVKKLDIYVDLTTDGKYSLTKETKELVKQITDDIKIYYITQSGNEIDEFKNIINNYDRLNSHVSVVYKDPVQYPKFASQYVNDQITEQSFLIVDETNGRSKYLKNQDVIEYQYDQSTGKPNVTGLCIEAKVDGALQAVTNEKLPLVYAVTGHGETEVSETMKKLLTDGNIDCNTLNTLTSESIPEDCSILMINQPQYDYTKEEADLVLNYLKSGKKAIVCVDFTTPTLKNFNTILDYYGVSVTDGIVLEGDSNYYRGKYPNDLVPVVERNEFTQDFIDSKYVLCPVSSGLKVKDDLRDTLKTTEILKTSDSAFSKTNMNSQSMEKEDGDINGPFLLGVDITEAVGDQETRLVVYSSKYIWDDQFISATSFANIDILYNTINKLAGQKNVLSIRSVSVADEKLVMTQAQKNTDALVFLGIIPLVFIIPGIVVVVHRRKK